MARETISQRRGRPDQSLRNVPQGGGPGRGGGGRGGAGGGGRRPPFGDDAPAAHRAARGRRSWRQRLLIGAGAIFVVLALLGVAGVVYFMRVLANIDRTDVDVDHVAAGEPANYLVVGSDERAEEGSDVEGRRTDTIMVVRLDPETQEASVLSFPRDLEVTLADTGETGRINSAYARADGQQVLTDTIRQNFGIEINHYIEVGFEDFEQLVDAIGGVSIWNENGIRDTHSGLLIPDRGCVTLNGQQALQFVRSRYLQYMTPDGWSDQDPFADLSRIDRQQVFIRRALSKALSAARSNPLRARDIIRIGTGAVTIDRGTDPLELFDQFRDFNLNDLVTYPLPVITYDDQATVDLNREEAEPILNLFRGLPPGEISPGQVTVTVMNSTGEDGQANNAASAFQSIGFQLGEVGNIQEPHPRTTIYHLPGEENRAQRVARHITGGADIKVREDLPMEPGEVTLVTGDDFSTVHIAPAPVDESAATSTTAAAAPTPAPADSGGGDTETPPSTAAPDTTEETRPPPQQATQRPEYVVGDPPPGVTCE
jgi:LCP family protein required for cell wall assembly